MKTSILMLTYNAPKYVFKSIKTVHQKTDGEFELIVVDNHSKLTTRMLVKFLHQIHWIDKLYLNKQNDLFAGGNNLAAKLAGGGLKILSSSEFRC